MVEFLFGLILGKLFFSGNYRKLTKKEAEDLIKSLKQIKKRSPLEYQKIIDSYRSISPNGSTSPINLNSQTGDNCHF